MPRRRRPILGRTAACLATAALAALCSAPAAGATTLDGYLIQDPVSGWTPATGQLIAQVRTSVLRAEATALVGTGLSDTVSVAIWEDPHDAAKRVEVVLASFQGAPTGSATLYGMLTLGADQAASSFCQGATGKAPATDGPAPSVDGRRATCVGGEQVVTFVKANVLALVAGNATVAVSRDARLQSARLPRSPIRPAPAAQWGGAVVGAALGAVAIIGLLLLWGLRRRPGLPAFDGPGPGPYPPGWPGGRWPPPPWTPAAGWASAQYPAAGWGSDRASSGPAPPSATPAWQPTMPGSPAAAEPAVPPAPMMAPEPTAASLPNQTSVEAVTRENALRTDGAPAGDTAAGPPPPAVPPVWTVAPRPPDAASPAGPAGA